MRLQLIKGTKEFAHIQAARKYILNYLKNHINTFLIAEYDFLGAHEMVTYSYYDFVSEQNFNEVVGDVITHNIKDMKFQQFN